MDNFYKISNKIQSSITAILGRCSAFLMIAVTLFALAEIIRRYIENRVNFPALDLTTYEILNIITALIKKEESISLKNILEISDLVKFAKKIPDQIENVKNLNLATDFVKKTKKEIINE